MTPYHSQYWAYALTIKGVAGSIENLTRSISNARVDLNPHQVDAALFALRSPLSRGRCLADEVGLGKTIEAGIVTRPAMGRTTAANPADRARHPAEAMAAGIGGEILPADDGH